MLGQRVHIDAPFGIFAAWTRTAQSGDRWLLLFRGGRPMPWWREDALLLAALVTTYSNLGVKGVAIVEELDSQLTVEYIEALEAGEAQLLVGEALSRWTRKSRLNKSSPRARAVCPHCPVKQPCDQLDLETGATQDWPLGLPVSARS